MSARTLEECQLNPDLVEMLLNHSYDRFSAWNLLLAHDAAPESPDLRWNRWKKIAAMFVKHLHSLEDISKFEDQLGQAGWISPLSRSFVRHQLTERVEQLQLATIESPLQSPGRRPPEQSTRGAKRQKKKQGHATSIQVGI